MNQTFPLENILWIIGGGLVILGGFFAMVWLLFVKPTKKDGEEND